jgi:hypothetical protein
MQMPKMHRPTHHKVQLPRVHLFSTLNQVTAKLLFPFNGFKQRLEIAGSKSIKVVSLNDFDEHGGSVQYMLFKVLVSNHE